jgi:hypothetical protein
MMNVYRVNANDDETVFKRFTCLKTSQFKRWTIGNDTLVIWDESHYAQNKGNKPFDFFQRSGLNVNAVGTSLDEWGTRNNFLLTVSATPFAEVADMVNFGSQIAKFVIRLMPGPLYRGVDFYRRSGLIHESFQINRSTMDDFMQLLRDNTGSRPKYAIIRAIDSKADIIKVCAREVGWHFEEFNSDTRTFNEDTTDSRFRGLNALKQAPAMNTIVLIKGRARMGQVVPKQHISFVFETSKKAKTDVILQSLLGRMCGYGPYDDVPPNIYVPGCFLCGPTERQKSITREKFITQANAYKRSNPDISDDEWHDWINAILMPSWERFLLCELDRYIHSQTDKTVMPKTGNNLKGCDETSYGQPYSFIPFVVHHTDEDDFELVDTMYQRGGSHMGRSDKDFVVRQLLLLIQSDPTAFHDPIQRTEIIQLMTDWVNGIQTTSICFRDYNDTKHSGKFLATKLLTCERENKPMVDIAANTTLIEKGNRIAIAFDSSITDESRRWVAITGFTFDASETTKNFIKKSQTPTTTGKEIFHPSQIITREVRTEREYLLAVKVIENQIRVVIPGDVPKETRTRINRLIVVDSVRFMGERVFNEPRGRRSNDIAGAQQVIDVTQTLAF